MENGAISPSKKSNPITESERRSIRPGGDEGKGIRINEVDKNVGAASAFKNAEKNAIKDVNAVAGEAKGGSAGWRNTVGKNLSSNISENTKKKGKFGLKKALPLIGVGGALLALVPVIMLGAPMFMIGAIDYNLQESLGFTGTIAIIESQGLNILSEMAASGEVPRGFADDLAKNGITVGQVTASGDFIKTNSFIANIDNTYEVAASGLDFYRHGADGELALLFDNQVVNASDIVATVESNPKMYAAYSDALDVSARFYYGNDVNEVYKDLGLSRGAFNGWESSGDEEADQESFNTILTKSLKKVGAATMAGCSGGVGEEGGDCDEGVGLSAEDIDSLRSVGRTNNATQLLNAAISSAEPQQAASAFLAIEEPIQRARIDGSGPVNQVMAVLSTPTEVSYTDVNTQERTTVNKSILETTNFAAAVSGGGYSTREANNFSRDRVLLSTDTMDNDTITGTTVETDRSSSSITIGKGDGNVNSDVLDRARGSVEMATADFDDALFSSVVGGNRVVEGGSYLSNTINARTLGAMPSDSATIANYQKEVNIALNRKIEADRASKSPFDLSSPNTFLGSLAYGFAQMLIKHTASNNGSVGLVSIAGAAVDLAGASVNDMFGNVSADDQKYTALAGECATVKRAANVEGDLYCNSHNTISTKYMQYTKSQWQEMLGSNLDGDNIASDGGLDQFRKYGMGRDVTVGVKSASVCEEVRGESNSIVDSISKFFGIYQACNNVDEGIATGSKYTLSDSNPDKSTMEQFSGYVLYDTVYALISESQSSVSRAREAYYAVHPKDESAAGKIARMSGMTKAEAEIALNYAAYLSYVANYNPGLRYAFARPLINIEKPVLIVEDSQVKENVYCFWRGKVEFSDLRERNQVA